MTKNYGHGPCKTEGCKNFARTASSGLCSNCYQKTRLNGDPLVDGWSIDRPRKKGGRKMTIDKDAPEKKCPRCRQTKPRDEYYIMTGGYMSTSCKVCWNAKRKAERIQYKLDNPKPPKPETPCAFEECDRVGRLHFNGGKEKWCKSHYQQLWNGLEPRPLWRNKKRSKMDGGFRRCTACDTVKSEAEFYRRTSNKGNQSICKPCYGIRNSFNQYIRHGKPLEALRTAQRMLPADRKKYLDKWASLFGEGEFERSNGLEVT